VALWVTTEAIKGLSYEGGFQILLIGGLAFTVINILLIPLLKILLLPLNLLTLGFFAWVTNVLALYALTTVVPQFRLAPYYFPGYEAGGFIIPAINLSTLWVAFLASLMIGFLTHLLHWLMH
jgi:putative membrane protein